MNHREVMQQALEAIRIFREWEMGQDYESCRATVLARALAAEESLGAALAEQCQCGDRPAAECPGAWEPGCDLGANEAHAKVHEPQEPVAWGMRHSDGRIYDCIAPGEHDREPGQYTVPLYTHPAPQRQPLADEEILAMVKTAPALHTAEAEWLHVARAIERAHGIGGQDE